jgi:type II secretory pathway predicted ATPase ExeA
MDDGLLGFYGFTRPPFGPVTDAAQIFRAYSRTELMTALAGEVLDGADVIGVRGGPGIGKTSLLPLLAAELQSRQIGALQIAAAQAAPRDIQRLIGDFTGASGQTADPGEVFRRLRGMQGKTCLVLLFDDAHVLPTVTYRYLATLMELCRLQAIRIPIVLFGDLGMWPGLEHPDLQRLRQAAVSQHMISCLRLTEATNYLDHKLRFAGQPLLQVMTRSAMTELLDRAHCVPDRLEALAQRALLHGYQRRRKPITVRMVRQALGEEGDRARPGGWGSLLSLSRVAAMLPMMAVAGLSSTSISPDARATLAVLAAPRPAVRVAALPLPVSPKALPPETRPALQAPPQTGGPGLALVAAPGDDIVTLYSKVYRGVVPPPLPVVLAANRLPVKPGAIVIFPEPPHGWPAIRARFH